MVYGPVQVIPQGRYFRTAFSEPNPLQLLTSVGAWGDKTSRYALNVGRTGLQFRSYEDGTDTPTTLWEITP